MLDVDNILTLPLKTLVLQPPVPELICGVQTTALFAMDQSSLQPQPQYVDSAIQSRVNPVTSSSNFEDTIGRPAVIHRERHKLKDCKGRTDHFVTRTAPTGAVTSAPAITNIPNSATASTIGATASTTASTQLFFGRPQPKQSTQIGQAPKEYVTCIPVHDLLPSACYAHTYITANKHPPIEIWSVHSIYTLTSAVLPSTFSTRSQSLARYTASPPRSPQPSSLKQRTNPLASTKITLHRASGPKFQFHLSRILWA